MGSEIRVHIGGSSMVTFHLWIFEECLNVPIYKLEEIWVEPPVLTAVGPLPPGAKLIHVFVTHDC